MSAEKVPVLGCDIDGTLLSGWSNPGAGDAALQRLCDALEAKKARDPEGILFGDVTGRVLANHRELERRDPAFERAADLMDFKITGVGSEISLRQNGIFELEAGWPDAPGWNYDALQELLGKRPELDIQPEDALGDYKLSFDVTGVANDRHDLYVAEIAQQIAGKGLSAEVIFSMGQYLDVLPKGVNKGSALNHAVGRLVMPSTAEVFLIAAGDTMNDKDMLAMADLAILPGNADDTLRTWAEGEGNIRGRLYIATHPYAAGIHEGLLAHKVL